MAPEQAHWHSGPRPNHVRPPQGLLPAWVKMPVCALSHFNRIRLRDPKDYNPPGSSVHGILQTRILEWAAMLSSKGSS